MSRTRAGSAARAVAVSVVAVVVTSAVGHAASSPPPTTEDSAGAETTAPAGDVVGTSWTPAVGNLEGLESECGNLSELSIRPDRDEIIVGVARAGLWRSSDGGATWNPLGQGEGSGTVTHRLSTIVYDPDNAERFWVSGTYNGRAVFVTEDGGTTFRALGEVLQGDMLDVDFTDPARATLVIGIHERGAIWKSTDSGATWVNISNGLPPNVGITSAVSIIDPQTYLYGTQTFNGDQSIAGSGIFRTADGGATWTMVLDHGVIGRPYRDADGAMYWLLAGGGGMASSSDSGATWTITPSTAISPNADNFVVLPDGRFATISDNYVITSADHGATWRIVDAPMPYDPSGLTYSPHRNRLYIWRFECETGPNPVLPDSIMQLEFTPAG